MATINVLTDQAALATLAQSIVSATINGSGHLILTRGNGSTVDGGDFTAAMTAVVNAIIAAALNPITVVANSAAAIPLKVKGTVSQTGNLQEWQNSAGVILAKVDKDGKFTGVLTGATIDGTLNTLSNINASKVDSAKVTVNTTAPSTPAVNDIWINPNGT